MLALQILDIRQVLYYVNAKAFYIELATDIDIWEFPPVLSSFAKRGEYSIDSYWSRLWIEQRIIPRDRQNIDDLVKRGKLTPVRTEAKTKLFLKNEVLKRKK